MPSPFSPITVLNPSVNSSMKSKAHAFLVAFIISSKVALGLPYRRFSSIVPEKKYHLEEHMI